MTGKEELLDLISRLRAQSELSKVYGNNWLDEEFRLRRSHTAGEICLLFARLERLKAKANRRPKSKGARKAQRELKAGCRKLEELSRIVTENISAFHPSSVQYLSEPLNTVSVRESHKINIIKRTLEIRMPHKVT